MITRVIGYIYGHPCDGRADFFVETCVFADYLQMPAMVDDLLARYAGHDYVGAMASLMHFEDGRLLVLMRGLRALIAGRMSLEVFAREEFKGLACMDVEDYIRFRDLWLTVTCEIVDASPSFTGFIDYTHVRAQARLNDCMLFLLDCAYCTINDDHYDLLVAWLNSPISSLCFNINAISPHILDMVDRQSAS